MLKILHTADWHLGVRLHKRELTNDFLRFFDFLIETIRNRNIDVLLVSGDIFDHANPSQDALQLYYDLLIKLHETKCKVIITGGNHDSPAVLNMTRSFLRMMDIHVVGKAEEDSQKQIIPIMNEDKQAVAIVCAVPYLRERDIRLSEAGESDEEKKKKRKEGVKEYFFELVQKTEIYGDIPVIMMAHLFASGADTKEQTRDITIGGLDAFSSGDFPARCSYVALGHIHRPMIINNNDHVRYSGSPIALSFAEKEHSKQLVEIIVSDKKIAAINSIPIPEIRKLIKFRGTFSEVKSMVENFINPFPLKAFAELEIIQPERDLELSLKIHRFIADFAGDQLEILTYKYERSGMQPMNIAEEKEDIEAWSEKEILEEFMTAEKIGDDDKELIRSAFDELLNMPEPEDENQ
jgi:exonuclease SbcD